MATVSGPSTSCRLHVMDRKSGLKFLIETGAEVSLLPPTPVDRQCKLQFTPLPAANGSVITTYGQRSLTLDLGLRRQFQWVFIIADVDVPILGTDFLSHYHLLVDMQHLSLHDATTNLRTSTEQLPGPPALQVSTVSPSASPEFAALLAEMPEVSQPPRYDAPVNPLNADDVYRRH